MPPRQRLHYLVNMYINDSQPVAGLSSIDQEQDSILADLTIKKPTLSTQLTLL